MPYATFTNLLYPSGAALKALTGRALGPLAILTYLMNAVELQFAIDPAARKIYKKIRPVQWAAPDSIRYRKDRSDPSWIVHSRRNDDQPDNPDPANSVDKGGVVAFYDSPGLDVAKFSGHDLWRLFVVQNFKSYVVGDPVKGGPTETLCDIVCWCSITSLFNSNHNIDPVPKWERGEGNRAAMGWADIDTDYKRYTSLSS